MNHSRCPSRIAPRRGFALIAALWLLVAFAAVGTAISVQARARRLSAANSLDAERGLAAAQAGLDHARSRLARLIAPGSVTLPSANPGDPWREAALILTDTVRFGNELYHVSIRDAGASLNLNLAGEQQIRRMLIALPIDAGLATEIAESVADWRDTDDLHHLHGAEADDYLRMGSPVLPANGDFPRMEDLAYVKGVTPAIFKRVRPLLTIVGTGQINLNSAPRPVLLSLPGMTDEAVAVLERMRTGPVSIHSLQELSQQLSSGPRAVLTDAIPELTPLVSFETRELDVRSEGWSEGSPVHKQVEALVVKAGRMGVVSFRKTT
jgi:type II secretory pathway component PulK